MFSSFNTTLRVAAVMHLPVIFDGYNKTKK